MRCSFVTRQHREGNVARVLGRIRLSRDKEESTSVERQREVIQRWAEENGHEIVAWAEDIDVSGAVSPFEAPALAPWLQEPGSREWDILCAWKLDRLARRSIPLHQLFGWIQDNDKTLACVADNIDLSNWVGQLVASVIAGVAEGELEAIRTRASASYKKLVETGRWPGGRYPYGYRPVKLKGGGFRLEHNPDTLPVMRRIVSEYLDGKRIKTIATELTAEGVPSPAQSAKGEEGGRWNANSVRNMLSSKSLLGWATHNGQVLLDEEGKPVVKAPPIIDMETYQRVQEKLKEYADHKTVPDRTSPLLGVLKCWECGANMTLKRNKGYVNAYVCNKCPKRRQLNADQVEALVYEGFLSHLGDYPIMEKHVTKANDLSNEIQEARESYDDLVDYIPNARSKEARAKLFGQLELIEQRIESLESQSTQTDTVRWSYSGQTYGDLWETLDEQGRRMLMVKAGFEVRAQALTKTTRRSPAFVEVDYFLPEDLRERLGIPSVAPVGPFPSTEWLNVHGLEWLSRTAGDDTVD